MTAPQRLPRRYPFTLAMLAALVAAALVTDSWVAEPARSWIERTGFAPRDLWAVRWERLVTSALVTYGGWTFWRAFLMVGLAVGAAERLAGSRRTALTFWGAHLLTLALLSLGFFAYLAARGEEPGGSVRLTRDVGPSAGYFACLGLALARLPAPWRRRLGVAAVAVLLAAFVVPSPAGVEPAVDLVADLAHLLAFAVGWLSARVAPSWYGTRGAAP